MNTVEQAISAAERALHVAERALQEAESAHRVGDESMHSHEKHEAVCAERYRQIVANQMIDAQARAEFRADMLKLVENIGSRVDQLNSRAITSMITLIFSEAAIIAGVVAWTVNRVASP